MQALDAAEVEKGLASLPEWRVEDGKLTRIWNFGDFVQAMLFVNEVAKLAERAGHHPDIDIRYNRVTLGLVTHDAGGLTERDIAMAARISTEFPIP